MQQLQGWPENVQGLNKMVTPYKEHRVLFTIAARVQLKGLNGLSISFVACTMLHLIGVEGHKMGVMYKVRGVKRFCLTRLLVTSCQKHYKVEKEKCEKVYDNIHDIRRKHIEHHKSVDCDSGDILPLFNIKLSHSDDKYVNTLFTKRSNG